jgi:carbon storage regulator
MLNLTRNVGERIYIGDDIVIMVVDIDSRYKVRLGIEAPKEIKIWREELYASVQKGIADALALGTESLPAVAGPESVPPPVSD